MFITGVQTYLESIFSVPFVPNKNIMLWLALKTLKVWVEEGVFRTSQFKQTLFKVMSFTEIFLWIFNLEQKIIVPSQPNNNNLVSWNTSQIFFCYTDSLIKIISKLNFVTSQGNVARQNKTDLATEIIIFCHSVWLEDR